ncbi:1878_t:CDS:2 [Dentiscutata heterogama]|uniref:1878_t:CDS:1 n=1 Tax=Dentiscutata heterogama TaxID=1316150 RepID=A0ACA9JWA2_9GLOM|nr:1878_t:CDS:2 [Dentiscutata heterogama]
MNDLGAHSELIENRVAVAKLFNFVRSNETFDFNKDDIRHSLFGLNFYLISLSKQLESIYDNGNMFFLNHEIYISEWEKLARNNQYNSNLFQHLNNQSNVFLDTIIQTLSLVNFTVNYLPSINNEDVISWCDPLFIVQCNYEFSRIEKISVFLKNSQLNLLGSFLNIQNYITYLDQITTAINKNKPRVTTSGQTVKNLNYAVNKIKAVHMKFLNNQDVTQRLYKSNDNDVANNSNAADNQTIVNDIMSKIYKSNLIGKSECQEFETRFSTLPVINGVYNIRHPQFLRNIRINVGNYIESLTFEWSDNVSFKYGGNDGDLKDFHLVEGEIITWVNIYVCHNLFYDNVPCGLEIRTNKWKTSGRLGNVKGPYRTSVLEAPNGYVITGLYGSFDKFSKKITMGDNLLIANLFSIKDKTALITGGGTGIGKMIAKAFVKNGVKVYIASRNKKNLEETAEELTKMGPGVCYGIEANLNSKESCEKLAAEFEKLGNEKLDILVNNAGVVGYNAALTDFPEEAWDDMYNLHVKCVFYLTIAASNKQTDPSRVIITGSILGIGNGELKFLQSRGGCALPYSSSKHAVHSVAKNLAVHLTPRGVNVNILAPGVIPVNDVFFKHMDAIVTDIPQEDIAGAAIYLSSRASGWVTGTEIVVDGGTLLSFKLSNA